MLDLQRVHGLFEVRRRTLDLHVVANRERAVRESDRRDANLAEEVEDFSDLLPFHPPANRWHAINISRSNFSRRNGCRKRKVLSAKIGYGGCGRGECRFVVMPLNVLEKSINKRVQLLLKDNRILEGKLVGYDDYMNMVLEDTEETKEDNVRRVGTVVLRGNNVVTIVPK
jgi:small nuclear ribonucleoprotein